MPSQAAELLSANPKTLARWEGKGLVVVRTTGGHRRYLLSSVLRVRQLMGLKQPNVPLSVVDVASRLDISIWTVRRMVKRGELPLMQTKKRRQQFLESDVDAVLLLRDQGSKVHHGHRHS
jgi:predicted site-specific integrase-resolvase